MTKFFNILKKTPVFGPFLGAKIIFPENPAPSRTTSYKFLAPCQNLARTNDAISRNPWTDGKTEGRTDPIL